MARNFELFTGRNQSLRKEDPRISLNTRSNFYINNAAYLALGSPESVVLMFDKAERTIGLKPSDASMRHSYPVRKQANSNSYIIGGIAFVNHYDIKELGISFTPVLEDGVLVLDLNTATPTVRRRRSK